METKEKDFSGFVMNGFMVLFVHLILLPIACWLCFSWLMGSTLLFLLVALCFVLFILCIPGYFSQEPNEARAMVFFGQYKGTFRNTGFFWVNPFMK